nr:hypothetical protein [Paenarthrobacter nitroguajacolicus]
MDSPRIATLVLQFNDSAGQDGTDLGKLKARLFTKLRDGLA